MDYILRGIAGNNNIRIFIATTKNTVQKAFEYHKTSPVMSACLGRSLTAAAIMGCMLKSDSDLITLKINGDGPGKGLIVTSNNKVNVKGYCFENIVDIPLKQNGKLNVSGALGAGNLTIIKDLGLKEPYVGQVPLISGEIAEDLTYYFAKSEQIPSSVSLGVLVNKDYTIKQAGGFIIQLLPNAPEEIICNLENKLSKIQPITTMLEDGKTPEDILNILLGDLNVKILEKINVDFNCNCSKKRFEKALICIGKSELEKIIKEDKKANLHCHFCNKNYEFKETELLDLLKNFSKNITYNK